MFCLKDTMLSLVTDGIKYATKFAKNQYPKIVAHKDRFCNKVSEVAEDASPIVEKAQNSFSKMVMDKYSEAVQLTKKAEEEKKKNKMKAIRNTIIATTIGFGAGAATGYLLVKKSQIKESDYVFTDEDVTEGATDPKMTAIPGGKTPATEASTAQQQADEVFQKIADNQQKTYQAFNDKYQISADGTTLIKR